MDDKQEKVVDLHQEEVYFTQAQDREKKKYSFIIPQKNGNDTTPMCLSGSKSPYHQQCHDKESEEELDLSEGEESDDLLPSAIESIDELRNIEMPNTPIKDSHRNDSQSYCQSPLPKPLFSPVKKTKLKYTIDTILAEKKEREKNENKMPIIDAQLKENLSRGGILKLAEKEIAPNGNLTVEQQKTIDKLTYLSDDLPEIHPGENVFGKNHIGCILPSLNMKVCGLQDFSNKVEEMFLNASPNDMVDHLTSHYLSLIYTKKTCPEPIMLWLLNIVAMHPSYNVVETAYQTIWEITNSPVNSTNMWIPSLFQITKIFYNYGASFATLFPEIQPDFLEDELRQIETTTEHFSGPGKSDFLLNSHPTLPIHNLIYVIQTLELLFSCSQLFQSCYYSEREILPLIIMICNVSMDKNLTESCIGLTKFQFLLAHIFEQISNDIWLEKVEKLCPILARLPTHHHNAVFLARLIPLFSEKGRLLSKALSFRLVSLYVFDKEIKLDNKDMKINNLTRILESYKKIQEVDFYQLNSVLTLIDMAIGNESLNSSNKSDLQTLIKRVQYLSGRIKDDRKSLKLSRVKDLLVRLRGKLCFMERDMKGIQSSLFNM